MVQTHGPSTTNDTAEYTDTTPRPVLDRVQITLLVIGLVFLAGIGVWIVRANQPAPIPPPAVSATTAPATTAPVSQSAIAYAAAEKTYRAWTVNYATADTHFDTTKLNPALVTPQVLARVKSQLGGLKAGTPSGTTAAYTQNIKTIRGAKYEPGAVTLTVCAVTNARFFDKTGKDGTITPDGKPAPVATEYLANDVNLTSADSGKTWVVAQLTTELDSTQGISC